MHVISSNFESRLNHWFYFRKQCTTK